jgi:hypothetical protein
MPMLGSLLHADWKIVTRTGESSVTEFFKGALRRTDSLPSYTEVLDFDHRSQVNWRSDLRQYVSVEWPPAEQHNDSSSGPLIIIERSTTDTGERKQFFGRTARHLVTRVTRNDGPETVIDGWYIEDPGLPKWKRGATSTIAILTASVGGQRPAPPRIEFKQTGPAPDGFPVWQRTTCSFVLPGGSRQNNDAVSEVTELVEGTLPDKLFQLPEGYQRVGSLPNLKHSRPPTWGELLQAHWRMIGDWFSSLFGAQTIR